MPLRVFLLAGEASGDKLGAGLIHAIRQQQPGARFEGVAGPEMVSAGCEVWASSDTLAVMGLTEVFSHLPRLLRLRRRLAKRLLADPPDVFVGIDAPDFNLGLERRLKRAGVTTVHYVSPSVWAWRPGRVHKVARAAHRVLCLLPFEPEYYANADVDAVFVGHPLADTVAQESDRAASRRHLGLAADGPLIAVLPGSRKSELRALGEDFAGAVGWLHRRRPDLRFVTPAASADTGKMFARQLAGSASGAPVTLIEGDSLRVMAAADLVLLASGTAALEAALIKRPMVVAYRLSRISQWMLETFRLVRIGRFCLPNLLAGRDLVPELLQSAVTPEALGKAALAWLEDEPRRQLATEAFEGIRQSLRQGADQRAASAILELCAGAGTKEAAS
ncbi:MAG: lipid-A-disaccharide synthase [Gammaproteobacteria bacterium]